MSRTRLPTVYELSVAGRRGVDLPQPDVPQTPLPAGELRTQCDLPELSQLDVVRHYTALSQRNLGVDSTFYPLGSCTMNTIRGSMRRLRGFLVSPKHIRLRSLKPCRETSR